MDIIIGILTAVEVIVCLLLILVVLMQRPRQEGLGASFGDAAASQVWGAQTTNVLQKFTVYLAIILFALTLLLAVLVSRHQTGGKSTKIFGDAKPAAAAPAAHSAEDDAKAKIMEKIQEAAKSGEPAKATTSEASKAPVSAKSEPAKEAPKAEDKKAAEPAKAPAPAKASEAPKADAPAPAAPAPAGQPK